MDKIIQLLHAPMACEESARLSFLAALFSALKNGTIEAFEKQITQTGITVKAFSMYEDKASVNIACEWDLDDVNMPDNSVALISLEGMIFPWKSYHIEQTIAMINSNPRLLGGVLFVNTPGGYIHRVDITSDAIKNSVKPIASYVTGVCASAALNFSIIDIL